MEWAANRLAVDLAADAHMRAEVGAVRVKCARATTARAVDDYLLAGERAGENDARLQLR
jgi:hypothetical protein